MNMFLIMLVHLAFNVNEEGGGIYILKFMDVLIACVKFQCSIGSIDSFVRVEFWEAKCTWLIQSHRPWCAF